VFGDSNVDNGNLYALSGGTVPASPPYFEGRFSNGPVVVEYAAQRLGVPLVGYGYGGARTGTDVPAGSFTIPSVLTQISGYIGTLNGAPIDPGAAVVVWGGSNDLLGAARNTPAASADLANRINTATGNIQAAVTELAQQGAQTILVANRTPRTVLTGDDNLNGIDLNAAIRPVVTALNAAFAAEVQLFDAYALVADMQTNPGAYGFTVTDQACLVGTVVCATPDTYTQWDAAHKTTRVHSLLADALIAQLQGASPTPVPEPASAALVLVGLVGIGFARATRKKAA
jgi:outer membrane lipase/esterase